MLPRFPTSWEYTWEYENPATQIDLFIGILAFTHSHHDFFTAI